MADVIVMPKLSDTMEEGVIAKWRKREGDSIKEGDVLAEIETDKATMEYEAPKSGVVLKIIASPGSKLKLGEPICAIGKAGESFDAASIASSAAHAPATKASAPKQSAPEKPVALAPIAANSSSAGHGRVKASPLAKKIAAEKGVNLQSIHGSGPEGRIIAKDVNAAGPSTVRSSGAVASFEDQLINNSMMRQTIAKRLHAAKNDAPHFYLTVSANMSAINAWRKKVNAGAKENDIKISVNDIVMLAVGRALRQHPSVNASWEGERIRQFGAVHVAMAVALPTGLITPVIKNTDQITLRGLATEVRHLADKAKRGELKPEEYVGGTFTVSNLGMFGIEEFTAIINPPQAAILAVGTTISVPWVNEAGEIEVMPRMKMTMSCDHRVIDGAVGAQFLQTLVKFLEDPLLMI